jgi:thiamine pyrophosphokinase
MFPHVWELNDSGKQKTDKLIKPKKKRKKLNHEKNRTD